MFQKLSKLASTKKYKVILISLLAIGTCMLLGYYFIHLVSTSPVGVKVTSKFEGKAIKDGYPKLVGQSPAIQKKTATGELYPYLFEAKILSNNIAYKKLREFPSGHRYLTNESALISTMSSKNIKTVNKLWQKNSSNYNFNTPDNRFAAGIGLDSAQMVSYLNDTPEQTLTWINTWTSTVQTAKTPVSQAVFGLIVNMTVKDNLGLLGDSYFVPVQGQLSFGGITQFTNANSVKNAPSVTTPSGSEVIAKSLIKGNNSLYQVKFNQSLLGNTYVLYAYVAESGTGRLRLLGYWYAPHASGLPESVIPISDSRSALDFAVKSVSGVTNSDSSVSWSDFYNTYK